VDEQLQHRLDQIFDKVTTDDFVSGKGLGNEIGFFIFDYPPEHEIAVRNHVEFLLQRIGRNTQLKVTCIDLFALIVDHLKERGLLEKSIELEKAKGSEGLLKALKAPLKAESLVRIFIEKAKPAEHDLVFITGVGNAYPIVRSHSLLNNLQPVMEDTPLILFYPGRYDGQTVQLFGKLTSSPYYRAFRLIP